MNENFLRNSWIALWLVVVALHAQAPASAPLAFEVASIKSTGPLNMAAIQAGKMPRVGMKVDGALCDIGSFTLKDLIRTAYEVKDYQVTGPDWLGSPMTAERFNLQATMPAGATEKDVPKMLQALLAERFKLVVHRETKDHSVYALVVAKGGPKMKEAEPDPPAPATPAEPVEPKKGEMVMGQGSSQVRISGSMDSTKGVTVNGGPQGQMHMTMSNGITHMEAAKMSMPTLAEAVTRFVDRPVVDMTDLKGNYQIALDLSMEDLRNVAKAAGVMAPPGPGSGGGAAGSPADSASEPAGSTIFSSMQQMGLKLEARKAPMPFIVIDHVEKSPTEN